MKKSNVFLLLISFLMCCCISFSYVAAVSYAADPPGTILWDYQVTGTAYEGAVDTNGNIYYGTETGIVALNADGSMKWNYESGSEVPGIPAIDTARATINFFPGLKSFLLLLIGNSAFVLNSPFWAASVAMDDDGVTYIGVRPGIVAFDLQGDVKWVFRQSPDSWNAFCCC
jgi:hypothetical protein